MTRRPLALVDSAGALGLVIGLVVWNFLARRPTRPSVLRDHLDTTPIAWVAMVMPPL